MITQLLKKLRSCQHKNTNAFNYVRDDGLMDELVSENDPKRRELIKDHLSGMRLCLDCGATQRFKRSNPLAIGSTAEPWLAPWLWRKMR